MVERVAKNEEGKPEQSRNHNRRASWRACIENEDVAIVLTGYFALSIVGFTVLTAIGVAPASGTGFTLSMAINAVAAAVSVGALAGTKTIVTLASIGLKRAPGRWLAIGAAFGVLAWFLSGVIGIFYVWITGDFSNPRPELDSAYQGTNIEFVFLVILGGLLVPFGEELVFRGVLYTWLRRWGVPVATGVSVVVFGLLHGGGLLLFTAMFLGVLAAFAYERSGSLWPAVVAHSVANTVTFFVGWFFPL